MSEVHLIQINIDGTPHEDAGILSKQAADVCAQTVALYRSRGFTPPWVGYLAIQGLQLVGTCAFASAPKDGRVEIAYFTFPEFEGRGIATAMATKLIEIAQTSDDHPIVFAQTLPVVNASNHILKKLGFKFAAEVSHPEEGMVWEWELNDIH
jgi:[ribosomal protein S5]-alanine N-acetyltransferase